MEDFDSFYIAPILLNQEGDKGLYEEIAEAMQLLGLNRTGECYEVLQVQEALLLCSGESASLSSILSPSSSSSLAASPLSSSALSSLMPSSLSLPTSIIESSLTASLSSATTITTQISSLSLSSSSVMASSLSSTPSSLFLPSSSTSLSSPPSSSSPPPPASSSSSLSSLSQSSSPIYLVASLNVASGSTTMTSRCRYSNSCSCDLCLENNTMDFLKEALPCGHLFCQSCLLCLDNESCSSSSEDISCILDGCKGYLAPTEKTQKSAKVLEYCPFCKSLQLPQREEDNTITTNSCSSTGASARYRCCYCQNRFSLSNF